MNSINHDLDSATFSQRLGKIFKLLNHDANCQIRRSALPAPSISCHLGMAGTSPVDCAGICYLSTGRSLLDQTTVIRCVLVSVVWWWGIVSFSILTTSESLHRAWNHCVELDVGYFIGIQDRSYWNMWLERAFGTFSEVGNNWLLPSVHIHHDGTSEGVTVWYQSAPSVHLTLCPDLTGELLF